MSEMYDEKPKKRDEGGNTVRNIIFIVIGLFVLLILAACVMVVILALLGPTVGNIFSNVIDGLSTSSP